MNEIIPDNNKNKLSESLKELVELISKILGIIAVLMTGLVFTYQFVIYLFSIQLFNYWSIDYSFYNNDVNIINNLLYSFLNICFLLLIGWGMVSIKNNNKQKLKKCWLWALLFASYAVGYFLINLKELLKFKLDNSYVIIQIVVSFILFFALLYYSYEIEKNYKKWKEKKIIDLSLQNMIKNILISVVASFITLTLLGFINTWSRKNYQIIINDTNKCSVILYSTKDYYIIADCKINDDTLNVYKRTQRKIDNYNIISQWKKFKKVEKS